MQLSAFADLESATWDVAVDGRWLGAGPGEHPIVDFDPMEEVDAGTARLIVVWLSSGETFTLSALRADGAKGQDNDAIAVALPDTRSGLQVFDPRLSTEYGPDGAPRRFGVELWLGEDPDGDQHPLRLAGEALADTAPLTDGKLSVYPMRAHSADVAGFGLYLFRR